MYCHQLHYGISLELLFDALVDYILYTTSQSEREIGIFFKKFAISFVTQFYNATLLFKDKQFKSTKTLIHREMIELNESINLFDINMSINRREVRLNLRKKKQPFEIKKFGWKFVEGIIVSENEKIPSEKYKYITNYGWMSMVEKKALLEEKVVINNKPEITVNVKDIYQKILFIYLTTHIYLFIIPIFIYLLYPYLFIYYTHIYLFIIPIFIYLTTNIYLFIILILNLLLYSYLFI
jgi:hypothetical protein